MYKVYKVLSIFLLLPYFSVNKGFHVFYIVLFFLLQSGSECVSRRLGPGTLDESLKSITKSTQYATVERVMYIMNKISVCVRLSRTHDDHRILKYRVGQLK